MSRSPVSRMAREALPATPRLIAGLSQLRKRAWKGEIAPAATLVPVLVVLACAGALWLVSGVGLRDALLFLGYEAVFVLGPGWIVYGILRPRAHILEQLAFGWGVGYALEIGAFALTAALGARPLLVGYPVLPVLLLGLARRKRRRQPRTIAPELANPLWIGAVAAIVVVALVLVSAALFPPHPLPGTVPRVEYTEDMVYHLSLAGEALHHWPLTNPTVSGEQLRYHAFAHMHMAAVAQVTGIDLSVVVFRLALLPMTAVFVFQLAVAGAELGRRRWVGPLAAALLLLVSEIDLDPHRWIPFLGAFFVGVYLSPTFLLGLLFFVPITVLLVRVVVERERPVTWRDWTLLGVFCAGAAGAKVAALPVVIAGVALFLVARRQFERRSLGALVLSCAVFGGIFLLMYRGGNRIRLDFPASVGDGVKVIVGDPSSHPLLLITAVAIGFVALFGAPLSGLVWFAKAPGRLLATSDKLLLSFFAVSLGPYLFFDAIGQTQLFFPEYGIVAAGIVSATGIYCLWTGSRPSGRSVRSAILFAVAWAAALVLEIKLADVVTLPERAHYLLWYGFPAGVVLALVLALWRAAPARRGPAIRLLLAVVLTTAAVNIPLDLGPGLIHGAGGGESFYGTGTGLTPGLYSGLQWLRDRTSTDAVVAVSNYSVDPKHPAFDNVNYSAFAERRTFLEGWISTTKAQRLGAAARTLGPNMPYPERLRLNEAVFKRGDRTALQTLVHDYAVRYLLVDLVHGGRAANVASLGRLTFSNTDVAIFAVGDRRATSPAAASRRPHAAPTSTATASRGSGGTACATASDRR